MAHAWDPERYLTYADERGRPFVELIARVDAVAPEHVVDLGCGPGNLTRLLAARWPSAQIEGIDSSAQMIAAAHQVFSQVRFEVGDVATWRAVDPVDVLVSNATLQWVPGHLDLLGSLLDQVRPGGWFAFGVPGNFDQPSHTIRRDLAREEPYVAETAGVSEPFAHDAGTYREVLVDLGCTVDAWETTYLHGLSGPDPVFTWISGTSARPTLQALDGELRAAYETELKARLRVAYPPTDDGVVLPFRRVFVVAQKQAQKAQQL